MTQQYSLLNVTTQDKSQKKAEVHVCQEGTYGDMQISHSGSSFRGRQKNLFFFLFFFFHYFSQYSETDNMFDDCTNVCLLSEIPSHFVFEKSSQGIVG